MAESEGLGFILFPSNYSQFFYHACFEKADYYNTIDILGNNLSMTQILHLNMHNFVHQNTILGEYRHCIQGNPGCRTYKMHTAQTSTNNQFIVCIILQCCILLFLHTYELVYMKKHSINTLLKLKYPDCRVLISGCKRKVLSLEKKLEMNILK